jgi:hypothetical protein
MSKLKAPKSWKSVDLELNVETLNFLNAVSNLSNVEIDVIVNVLVAMELHSKGVTKSEKKSNKTKGKVKKF